MINKHYKINSKDFFDLLGRLTGEYRVIVPYHKGDRLWLGDFDPAKEADIELGGIRQGQPIKSILSPVREKVSQNLSCKCTVLVGAKACDLQSLDIQDFVFLKNDPEDPIYAKNRSGTFIMSSDCANVKETCFCLAMDGAPYARSNFDINLSSAADGFIAEVGSQKGSALIDRFKVFFKDCSPKDASSRDDLRAKVSSDIKANIARRGTPEVKALKGAMAKSYDKTELWKDSSSTCVECGACNLVCPTCHCFLLYDQKDNNSMGRYRIWDSCLYKTFARVAGGANPRRHLYERLRNRFDKKFDFFPHVLDIFACTGCGRCIDACPGDIDIREVLKGLVSDKWNKPPHE